MISDLQNQVKTIMRSYSFEVEQRLSQDTTSRNLGQALVQARKSGHLEDATSPWRCFFETRLEHSMSREVF